MRVEPGHVARRDLQVDDAHRPVLEQLSMMWFLMDRHDRRLTLSSLVWRLPGRCLPMQGNGEGEECDQAEGGDKSTWHHDTSQMFR
jgi:hypothetical protein